MASERWWLAWFDERPFETLFVDGNHENFDRLDAMPVEAWRGGRVHRVSKKVRHLMRGEVFEIDGVSVLTFGGASSHDKRLRKEGTSWWPQELPSGADVANAQRNLDRCGRQVDIVVTHCAPTSITRLFDRIGCADPATDFLQRVLDTVQLERWYFGHHHMDRDISERFRCVYKDVIPVSPQTIGLTS